MKIHTVKTRLVNSYVIEDGESMLVIDVAQGGAKYLLGYIEEVMGRPCAEVSIVLCTHDDFDHNGGIFELSRACDAKVGVPYASHSMRRKLMNNPAGLLYKPMTGAMEAFRPRAWDMYFNPRRDRMAARDPQKDVRSVPTYQERPRQPAFFMKDKHMIPGFSDWEVLHTPGHSWESLCFYHQPSASLISGDTLLGSRKKNRLVIPSILANPHQLNKSVNRLKHLNLKNIYPGHGISFHGDALLDHLA